MGRRIPTAVDDRWTEAPGSRGEPRRGAYLGPVRITPVRVVLVIALFGTLGYLAYALTVRDASQIPMLAAGAAVLGIVFLGLAVAGAQGTLQAGREGRNSHAFAMALGGGLAAMIGFGAFAGAIVLALVWRA